MAAHVEGNADLALAIRLQEEELTRHAAHMMPRLAGRPAPAWQCAASAPLLILVT